MQDPKLSIIIPSFNKVKYISSMLQSIISQEYPNLEVMIQDPGSTDGSLEIIRKYVKEYPGIFKLYIEKDEGQLDAINKGFKKAKGDILAYINADDVYEKNCFKYISDAYAKDPSALWFAGRGKVINEKGCEIAGLITKYKNILLLLNTYPLLLALRPSGDALFSRIPSSWD